MDDPSPSAPPSSPVDTVIGDLLARRVMPQDRKRLGDALDKANAPAPGRAGSDEAVGRIFGR